MMIKLVEYARLHGKQPQTILTMIKKGRLPAQRSGNRWYVDSDIPYPADERIKHGAYIGIRRRAGKE